MKAFQVNSDSTRNRHPEILADLQSMFSEKSPRKVLSFGCSYGHECADLKELFPDSEIFGVDCSEEVIETARLNYPLKGVSFAVSDYARILENGPFDLIVANSVFCVWPPRDGVSLAWADFEKAMVFFAMVMREGGVLCLFNAQYLLSQTLVCGFFDPVEVQNQLNSGFVSKSDIRTGKSFAARYTYEGKTVNYTELRDVYDGPVRAIEFLDYFCDEDQVSAVGDFCNVFWRRTSLPMLSGALNSLNASRAHAFRFSKKYTWCSSFFEFQNKEYVALSCWPEHTGFRGFLQHSRIEIAQLEYGKIQAGIRPLGLDWPAWAASMQHGPALFEDGGILWMYFTGASGESSPEIESSRNVGYACTRDMLTWDIADKPIFPLSHFGPECFSVSNPVPVVVDDIFYLFVKVSTKVGYGISAKYMLLARGQGENGFSIVSGVELGGKSGSVEDGCCFFWNGLWYFICLDFEGTHNETGLKKSLCIWVSSDFRRWAPMSAIVPVPKEFYFDDGVKRVAHRLGRPSIKWEDRAAGKGVLYCGVLLKKDGKSYVQGFPFELN